MPEIIAIPKSVEFALEDVPTISPIVAKINEIAGNAQASPRDLVKVVMVDPVLTAKVIRLVNSSFYNLPNEVKSLAQATVLLGMNTVKNLAIATAVLGVMFLSKKRSPIDPVEFWRHCLGTAVGSRMLAQLAGIPLREVESYFVAGLLHDLGKVLFIKAFPEIYSEVVAEAPSLEVSLQFSELAHFGCSHVEAGAVLAMRWKLDRNFVDVIRYHHLPTSARTPQSLTDIVAIAQNVCKRCGVGDSGDTCIEEYADQMALHYGIQPEQVEQVGRKLPDELDKAAIFLNLAMAAA